MSDDKVYKVGSRKSELALIQTNCVIESLKELYPNRNFEVVTMDTLGDRILDRPLPKIGEKSLFTKELETALADGCIDLVVHSLKDMPTSLPSGLAIGAILQREDPQDALILHSKHRGLTLGSLPPQSIIGTSSLRRTAQLRRKYPDIVVKDIRGNLQTRLRKLDSGDYDGIILAVAGVNRMGWEHRISQVLNENEMLYAVGQGALAVECRIDSCSQLLKLTHYETIVSTVAERSLLNKLGGGCSAPVAVHSVLDNDSKTLTLTGAVWSLDGSETLKMTRSCSIQSTGDTLNNKEKSDIICGVFINKTYGSSLLCSHKLGVELATELIDKGALKIINEAKSTISASLI